MKLHIRHSAGAKTTVGDEYLLRGRRRTTRGYISTYRNVLISCSRGYSIPGKIIWGWEERKLKEKENVPDHVTGINQ